jgi:UDPglucose 6-dehydrogenase
MATNESWASNGAIERPLAAIGLGEQIRLVRKVREALGPLNGRQIAILDAPSQGGDDGKTAPSAGAGAAVLLCGEGATVMIYDPFRAPSLILAEAPEAVVAGALLDAVRGADAVVIAGACQEYRDIDLAAIRPVVALPLLVDGAGCIDPVIARASGFSLHATGRSAAQPTADAVAGGSLRLMRRR